MNINGNILYDGQSPTGCSKDLHSEMRDNFKPPALKRPTPTRNKRLEQFMWQELYDEYIRYNTTIKNAPLEKANTEYYEEYCKHMPKEDLEAKEVLMNRYPLYFTCAVTVYNKDGDIKKDFKKHYSITRPVDQQTTQFG